MEADFKFRVDIRGPEARIAWRCGCQAEPMSETLTVAPRDVLAWVNKLLNDHRPHAKKEPETPPAPVDVPAPPV